ncbi:hypothetical protein [Winogradskyella poriferorum]|uniref:hypothetical protein n=1 Tax=Winogradskyella poriferorum TaxID=307627 RepID=UPI003D657A88
MRLLINLFKSSLFLSTALLFSQDLTEKRTNRFAQIDADGNEVITNLEMRTYYKDKLNRFGDSIDAKRQFYAIDANTNNIITLPEYLEDPNYKRALEFSKRWQYPERLIENVIPTDSNLANDEALNNFRTVDANKNRGISLYEMMLYGHGKIDSKTGEPINAMLLFYALDANKNSFVNLSEFKNGPNMEEGKIMFEVKKRRAIIDVFVSRRKAGDDYVKLRTALFYDFDIDENYEISLEEMESYYTNKSDNLGRPIDHKLRFYGLDTNENNAVELEEFVKKISGRYATNRLNTVDKQ